MAEYLYAASSHAVKELTDGGGQFNCAERLIEDLTGEQATLVLPGAPYAIAQIVAHMHYWQSYAIAEAQGTTPERPAHLIETFPDVSLEDWPTLRAAFLAGIEEIKRLADERSGTVSPARNDTTVGYELAENALHNAYHLGQIVLLRHLVGLWPPLGGDQNDW